MKTHNEYAAVLPWYDRIPKAVLAAIAVSYASSGGDWLPHAAENLAKEWCILHQAGIVPQAPSAEIRSYADRAEQRDQIEAK